MIGNKLEQSIISIFQNELSSTFSINEISKILKKSYPNINKKSNYLLKEGVLGKIVIGNSYQCYLNLANDKAKVLATMNEINKKEILLRTDHQLKGIFNELSETGRKYNVVTILIYKKNIMFVLEDLFFKQKIHLKSSITKGYNVIFFDKHAFQQYVLSEESFQKSHAVVTNTGNFINILTEISEELLFKKLFNKSFNQKNLLISNRVKDGKYKHK